MLLCIIYYKYGQKLQDSLIMDAYIRAHAKSEIGFVARRRPAEIMSSFIGKKEKREMRNVGKSAKRSARM